MSGAVAPAPAGRPWWQRLRPCVPRETAGGFTAAELFLRLQQRDLDLASHERAIAELRGQVDAAVRRADNLADLVRDIRELTGREGA